MLSVGTELGGYRIEGVLGRGGMGIVYEAEQVSLGRRVALKLLSQELSSDSAFRERFRREGRLQASLDHPNIVTVHEAGELDGQLFLAMHLIRGVTLKDLIERGLEPERTVKLLAGVAAALDAAHAAGLTHRDVKPRNVLVAANDHPYLADFGLTKAPGDATLTKTGHFMGTVAYIAPEQLRGEPATAASDIYSLACVLFECLTARLPFVRPTEAAIISAHLSDPPPRVTDTRPDLPAEIDAVIAAGMAKEAGARPANAGALLAAAAAALADDGAPPPEPTVERTPATRVLSRSRLDETPATVPEGRREPTPRRGAMAVGAVALAAIVAAIALVTGGGDGGGGSLTLGSSLAVAGSQESCGGGGPEPCTIVQTALRGKEVSAPSDGRITEWSIRDANGTFRLVTLSSTYELVARSDPEEVSGAGSFETDLPIPAGGRAGLEMEGGSLIGLTDSPGARLARWLPPLEEAPREADHTDPVNLEILYNATFEAD